MNTKQTGKQQAKQQESNLVLRAQQGAQDAFDTLASMHMARLRAVIRRMVGHPDDTDDLTQEALFKASQSLKSFRGDASFGSWLCAIGVNTATDFLRQQKRWRTRAQVIYGNQCHSDEALQMEIANSLQTPDFQYDAIEHIAYCWTCVARSLDAEQNAALTLREFMGLSNHESAKTLNISESIFRHRLSAARKHMQATFDNLCALVNKKGVCYQCEGLREGMPENISGQTAPKAFSFEQRIEFVKNANLDSGSSRAMHDTFYRCTANLEQQGIGDANEDSLCYSNDAAN